jgi:hypothetical protein
MVSFRFSPTHMSSRPWSQPLITCPTPSWKEKGCSRSRLQRNHSQCLWAPSGGGVAIRCASSARTGSVKGAKLLSNYCSGFGGASGNRTAEDGSVDRWRPPMRKVSRWARARRRRSVLHFGGNFHDSVKFGYTVITVGFFYYETNWTSYFFLPTESNLSI